jgi:hypothetical protein
MILYSRSVLVSIYGRGTELQVRHPIQVTESVRVVGIDMPKGGLEPSAPFSFIYRVFAAIRRFYQPHGSYTGYTKRINLPQIGTNRALILGRWVGSLHGGTSTYDLNPDPYSVKECSTQFIYNSCKIAKLKTHLHPLRAVLGLPIRAIFVCQTVCHHFMRRLSNGRGECLPSIIVLKSRVLLYSCPFNI